MLNISLNTNGGNIMRNLNHEKKLSTCEKEKFNFNEKKENTINSLFEVEHFLKNLKNICKGVKLYQIMRK